VALFTVRGPLARTVFVTFGALAAFQSSQQLNPSKFAYLAGFAIATGAAVWRLCRDVGQWWTATARLLVVAVAAILVLVATSFVGATTNGVALSAWLRDVSPYLLLAGGIVLALEVGLLEPRPNLEPVLAVGGLLAAVSFSIAWLHRGQFVELPVTHLVFPTFFVAAAAFAYAASAAIQHRRPRALHGILAIVIFALLLATGTRSALLLPLGAVASPWL
jgi:hypothetical protein